MKRLVLLWLALGSLTACGTNRPTIPDYLLHDDSGAQAGYPAGPYAQSIQKGAVIENFTFAEGWMDPKADNYDKAKLRPISFGDFYDPDGSKNYELLLIDTAAFWCSACKDEHLGTAKSPSLNDHYAELRPRGLGILALIFQDAASQPASTDDLVSWAETFEETIPLARDPEYQMGRYVSSTVAPLNMVVDAKTMKILLGVTGDQPAVLWPFIDDELKSRGK